MRARYIAIVGSDPDVIRAIMATDDTLRPVLCADGVVILSDMEPLTIATGRASGVVIGWVFHRHSERGKVAELARQQQADAAQTGGAALLQLVWGAYISILCDTDGAVRVTRDPSGAMPCYIAQRAGMVAVASDLDLLIGSGLAAPNVDMDEIARHLLAPDLRRARTCLVGVNELLRGQTLTIRAGASSLAEIWLPWTFATEKEQFQSMDVAIDTLRSVTCRAIGTWADCFQGIVLGVSGGLDSSIVAACLSRTQTPLHCQTFVTEESAGDERYYARELTGSLGIDLHERFHDIAQVDLTRSHAAHLPRPVARSFAQSDDVQSMETASACKADAFFSGAGGDNVFCYQHSVLPIVDRLLTAGPRRKTWITAREIARMTDTSLPKALALVVRRAWFRPRSYRWQLSPDLLSRDAISLASTALCHPWLDAPPDILPGKAGHVAYLLKVENYLEGFLRELTHPFIAPLLSQPILETCLKMPSWFFCHGGQDRAVARLAFREILPDTIINRSTKGGPDGFLLSLFETRRAQIAEILLSGTLMRQGLLDRAAVESALKSSGDAARHLHYRLLSLVDVEAWMGAMSMRGSRASD